LPLLLVACGISAAHSQALQITLIVSPHPSSKLSDWQSRRETATLMVTNSASKTLPAIISATLSLNGSAVSTTKPDAMPVLSIPPGQSTFFGGDIFPQNAVLFSGEAHDASRSGNLPEGAYELCITIHSPDAREVLSNKDCRNFYLTKYSLPVLIQPSDGSSITAGLEPTILFSWTPLVPAPPSPMNYRLRFVERIGTQNSKEALLNNRPLFEKVVPVTTQLSWPQDFRLPSAGGTFIWSIQAEDADGTPLIMPERFAEPFTLTVLPSQEECSKLLATAESVREELQNEEEAFWHDYSNLTELRKEYESANDRVDVYEMQRLEKEVNTLEQVVEQEQQSHEQARKKYDVAVEAYKKCLGH
jgi:hypothetical protein